MMFGNSQNPHLQAGTQPGEFFPGYIVRVLWSCLKGMIVSVVGALGRFYSQGEGNGPYEVQQSRGARTSQELGGGTSPTLLLPMCFLLVSRGVTWGREQVLGDGRLVFRRLKERKSPIVGFICVRHLGREIPE